MRKQEDGESVDSFVTALYSLASKCDYGTLHDEMIRDRIVVGISNQALSEKMQLDENLTLDKAAKLARESEAVKKKQPQIRETERKEVDSVRNAQQFKGNSYPNRTRKGQHKARPTHGLGTPKSTQQTQKVCTRCGKDHPSGKDHCPARISKCHKCGKVGHYQRMCRSAINTIEASLEEEWKFLGAITERKTAKPWMCLLQMNNRPVRFKIDTGADVSVIPYSLYREHYDGPLHEPKTSLIGPTQNTLNVMGCFDATIERGELKAKETVYLVDGLKFPLAGRAAITKLNLLSEIDAVMSSKEDVMTMFPELFNRLGLLKGSYQIELQEDAKTVLYFYSQKSPCSTASKS